MKRFIGFQVAHLGRRVLGIVCGPLLALTVILGWQSSTALAMTDPVVLQSKLQGDLEMALSRMLPKEKYAVQVSVESDTVMEKVLVEGETVSQIAASAQQQVSVPPLPGFNPEPPVQAPPAAPAGQSRQVYKMVEKIIVKQARAQVLVDETLPSERLAQVRSLVENVVRSQVGAKGVAIVTPVQMMEPVASENPSWTRWGEVVPWLIAGFLALTLLGLFGAVGWFLFKAFRRRSRVSNETVRDAYRAQDSSENQDRDVSPLLAGQAMPRLAPGQNGGASALPTDEKESKRGFLPLPARESFADTRSDLLHLFLNNAEVFRLYFMRLSDAAQVELYAALRGPAFDSLMEALSLAVPNEGATSAPPSEDQMIFYRKNFEEFIETHKWQQQQFFGFLHQLTSEQLLALTRGENALVGAVMIKFMRSEQSAYVMEHLLSGHRQEIVRQLARIKEMGAAELTEIERSVRANVERLPNFILTSAHEETMFWAHILTHTDKQDEILIDLERTQPELYEKLAKFRFRLDDLPSLPPPLIRKVLDEADNDELTKALLTLPDNIKEYALGSVEGRRLVQVRAQMVSYAGMPDAELREARHKLTTRFREVMA